MSGTDIVVVPLARIRQGSVAANHWLSRLMVQTEDLQGSTLVLFVIVFQTDLKFRVRKFRVSSLVRRYFAAYDTS